MGGNALKHLNPVRLSTAEVLEIGWRVQRMADCCKDTVARPVPWVLSKDDHGDVDVLISGEFADWEERCRDLLPEVAKAFGMPWPAEPQFINCNGQVTSLGIPWRGGYAQLDLIATPRHELRHACVYYAGGGLGMMLGRIADHYGLVFGTDGLRLRADPEKPWSRDILLTHDPRRSLQSLGFEPEELLTFKTEEELWKRIVESPYALPPMFTPAGTNSHNRHRDKVRPSFVRFQEWIATMYPPALLQGEVTRTPYDAALSGAVEDFGDFVRAQADAQKEKWTRSRGINLFFGMDGVQRLILAVGLSSPVFPDLAGQIIREMQHVLPAKEDRERLYDSDKESAAKLVDRAAKWAWTQIKERTNDKVE